MSEIKLKPWERDGSSYCFDGSGNRICNGSRMGIPNRMPEDLDAPITLTLERCNWFDGDYLKGGAYFGQSKKGEWIWCAYNDETEIFVRASTAEEVIAAIKEDLPNLTCVFPEDHIEWTRLDEFTKAYIVAALWTSVDTFDNMKRDTEAAGYEVHRASTLREDWAGYVWTHPAHRDFTVMTGLVKTITYPDLYDAWRAAYTHSEGEDCDDEITVENMCQAYSSDTALVDNYSADDLSQDALKIIKADCDKFQTENAALLGMVGTPEQNGPDFWLTRIRSGCGFMDRGYDDTVARRLSNAAKNYSESVNLFVRHEDNTIGIE